MKSWAAFLTRGWRNRHFEVCDFQGTICSQQREEPCAQVLGRPHWSRNIAGRGSFPCVEPPQGQSAADLRRICVICKASTGDWQQKDFYGGLLPSHLETIRSCWALGGGRCCGSLRDFQESVSLAGVPWMRAEKRALLPVTWLYNIFFLFSSSCLW